MTNYMSGYGQQDQSANIQGLQEAESLGVLGTSGQMQLMAMKRAQQQREIQAENERRRIAGSQIVAAQQQASETKRASQQQIDASNLMQSTYTQQQEQVREDLAPWRQAGAEAVTSLQTSIDAGPGEYTKSPGYEVRLAEGQEAITNRASMHGNVLSGATMKAGARFAEDYATKDYDNFLNRYYQSLQPKQQLAQIGQASAAQVGSQGQQTAGMVGQAQQYGGEAAAGGTMGAANIMAAQQSTAANRDYSYAAWKAGRSF